MCLDALVVLVPVPAPICHKYKRDGSKASNSHLSGVLCCSCIYSPLPLLGMVIWQKIISNATECPSLWFWIFQFYCLLVFICAACSLELNKACLLVLINNHRKREKSMPHGSACSHMCLHVWEQKTDRECKGDINKLCNFPTIKTSSSWLLLYLPTAAQWYPWEWMCQC